MAIKQLYINGTGSGTYGVYLNSDTYLDSPSLDYNEYSVPARNGNVINYNKRMNNIIRKFDCYINSNVLSNLNSFKKLIYGNTGYMKLESDYDTDTYQLGYLAQDIQVEPFNETGNFSVKFTLYFSCMPQKWFKTNTSATGTFEDSSPWLIAVASRNETASRYNVKTILSLVPMDSQPNDEYFMVFSFGSGLSNQTITNLSVNNSAGGSVIVSNRNLVSSVYTNYLICYGNGTASIPSYTCSAQGTTNITVLIPVTKMGLISATYVDSHGTQNFSFNAADWVTSATNTAAFGMNIDYELVYRFNYPSSFSYYSPLVVQSKLNNVIQNEAVLLLHFEQMDATTLQNIYDNFMTSNRITVVIDEDYNAKVVKGTSELDITSFLEVIGENNGRCDTLSAYLFKSSDNIGTITKVTLNPRWWKL